LIEAYDAEWNVASQSLAVRLAALHGGREFALPMWQETPALLKLDPLLIPK
jgi:hypothetical protein